MTQDVKDSLRAEQLNHEESHYVGKVLAEVPKLPAHDRCNARKTKKVGESSIFRGYCNNYPGQARDADDGRCNIHHSPNGGDHAPSGGAPEGNQNATRHGLSADPSNYAENLDDAEDREWIYNVSADLEDRVREVRGTVSLTDRVLVRRVVIKLHIVSTASDYIRRHGLTKTVHTENGSFEDDGPLVTELRQYDKSIIDDLKKLGLLDDPYSQRTDKLGEWREFVGATTEDEP